MAVITDLPIELIEHIILCLDPLDAARFAQTCSAYSALLYTPDDQHMWRELYLLQPFDDLRECRTSLGRPLPTIDWKLQLQRILRARTILTDLTLCKPYERCTLLRTLLDMICNCRPSTDPDSLEPSRNHAWVTVMLRSSALLDGTAWEPALGSDSDEAQLLARLHTYFGLSPRDFHPGELTRSRAFVYAMRNYKFDNDFGPYLMDGSGRVNWVHLRALHHVVSMHIVPPTQEAAQAVFNIFPMSMPWTQSVLPKELDLQTDEDWADVNGRWQCSFCFCDHRELLVYNNFNASDADPLNPELFDDPDFVEVYRSFYVELRVLGTEADPEHPGYPRINFGGSIDGHAIMVGHLNLTSDDQIRWHFTSGEHGSAIWSSEGVQVGNVRSKFGVLGAWTTVLHDRQDPVGPFWLWKVSDKEANVI